MEDGVEEAGADFLAELRERFAVDTEELASDKDLDLLADDALFAADATAAVAQPPATSALSGQEETEEVAVAQAVGDSQTADFDEDDGIVATAAAEEEEEEGKEGNDTALLLEDIKTMKVRPRASSRWDVPYRRVPRFLRRKISTVGPGEGEARTPNTVSSVRRHDT